MITLPMHWECSAPQEEKGEEDTNCDHLSDFVELAASQSYYPNEKLSDLVNLSTTLL